MASTAQLIAIVGVLGNLVRSAYIKRALVYVDADPRLNFWRVIHGNLLDMSVIEWCKLFGSDDAEHQQLHWKNVFPDHEAFRTGLLSALGIDRKTWDAYWRQMKDYRDHFAAHMDFDKRDVSHFPVLDHAIASACYYYTAVIAELRQRGVQRFPDDLRLYGEAFSTQTVEVASKAVAATADIPERVY